MPTDTSVNNLVINKLTKAQYDGIATKSETELYLVPDEVDTAPTSGSSNCVTSGGVYTAVNGKADKVVVIDASTLPSTLDPNKVYQMGTLTGSVTIPPFSAVPSGDTEDKIWCIRFSTSTNEPNIIWGADITDWAGGTAPTIKPSKKYEITVIDGLAAYIES